MKKVSLLLLIMMFVLASFAMADETLTPTTAPDGVKIISADDALKLVEKKDVQVFDMRKALNFGKGHVHGAVSIPFKWTSQGEPSQRTGEFDMAALPGDKNAKILFHSDGPKGWKSYNAAKIAAAAGYKNVMWMREGFDEWEKKGYALEH